MSNTYELNPTLVSQGDLRSSRAAPDPGRRAPAARLASRADTPSPGEAAPSLRARMADGFRRALAAVQAGPFRPGGLGDVGDVYGRAQAEDGMSLDPAAAPDGTSALDNEDEQLCYRDAGEAPTLIFGDNAVASVVSSHARAVLESILVVAEARSATITSTARTPAQQAAAMYTNLEAHGVASQRALYAAPGEKVIDAYEKAKADGKTAADIKAAMTAKVTEVGPGHVSNHCGDPAVKTVVDIAPSTVPAARFAAAVRADPRVTVFLEPPGDPAFHLEIPAS